MNKDELLKLVKKGESLMLEFKSDRGPLPDDEMLESVVCLANHHGGHLLVGVEDNGEITGLHKININQPLELWQGLLPAEQFLLSLSKSILSTYQTKSSCYSDSICPTGCGNQ